MSAERWKLQTSLWQYINDTLTYMATATDFYKKLSEWNDGRKKEHEQLIDIQKKADKIYPSFTKSEGRLKKIGKCINRRFQNFPELENALAEVLNSTLEGLEKLDSFLDAVEKLAVTSLQVFTENQIVYLPESFDYDGVQAVIIKAQQICPLLLKFKRDVKSFFLPNLYNVEILAFQLENYIDTIEEICVSFDESFNFEMCLEMAKEIVVDADDMCENNMQKMADQIKQLDQIRMDEDLRVEFLFQSLSSSADFVTMFDAKKHTMLSSLDELEQYADEFDGMNKGAKISTPDGGLVKKAGSILSTAGSALKPFAPNMSLCLTFTSVTMGLASEASSVVTSLTEAGVNHTHRKKAHVVLKSFLEDFQMIQDSLDDGVNHSTVNLKQSKMVVLVRVGKSVSKLYPKVMDVSSMTSDASAFIKVVAGKQKENGNAAKQSIKVAKGSKTKASKFLTARVALFRSQMESWEKIRNSLCQSKLTKEEIRNIFTKPFYLGDKEEQ